MAKPVLDILTVAAQQANWQNTINTDFERVRAHLEDGPLVLAEVAEAGDLAADFLANQWDRSLAFEEIATGSWGLYASDGSAWLPVAVPDILHTFSALDAHPHPSFPAAITDSGGTAVAAFDDTAVEIATFAGALSRRYRGKGLKVTFVWHAAAITGAVRWEVYVARQAAADSGSVPTFTAAVAIDATVAGTTGNLTYTTFTLADGAGIDSLARGHAFLLGIHRDGAHANDTMAGDALLVAVIVEDAE